MVNLKDFIVSVLVDTDKAIKEVNQKLEKNMR